MSTLTEELEGVKAERNSLVSEKKTSCQTSTEEMEKLLRRVTSLSEEKDHLQETLAGLRQEKTQLGTELEDRKEMVRLCGYKVIWDPRATTSLLPVKLRSHPNRRSRPSRRS